MIEKSKKLIIAHRHNYKLMRADELSYILYDIETNLVYAEFLTQLITL